MVGSKGAEEPCHGLAIAPGHPGEWDITPGWDAAPQSCRAHIPLSTELFLHDTATGRSPVVTAPVPCSPGLLCLQCLVEAKPACSQALMAPLAGPARCCQHHDTGTEPCLLSYHGTGKGMSTGWHCLAWAGRCHGGGRQPLPGWLGTLTGPVPSLCHHCALRGHTQPGPGTELTDAAVVQMQVVFPVCAGEPRPSVPGAAHSTAPLCPQSRPGSQSHAGEVPAAGWAPAPPVPLLLSRCATWCPMGHRQCPTPG